MRPEYEQEIAANLERAEQSIQAAKEPAARGYHDFAASRAYDAAFYGATAVLLKEGVDFSKRSGVIASIHQRFVKTRHSACVSATSRAGYSGCREFLEGYQILAQEVNKGKTLPNPRMPGTCPLLLIRWRSST